MFSSLNGGVVDWPTVTSQPWMDGEVNVSESQTLTTGLSSMSGYFDDKIKWEKENKKQKQNKHDTDRKSYAPSPQMKCNNLKRQTKTVFDI